MARLDLKKAELRFVDGYRDTGAVNNVAGYSAGAVSITYDGTTNPIPAGTLVRFGSNQRRYKVTAATSTVITISPGLVSAVVDNAVIHVIGRYLGIKIGDGDITYSAKKAREYLLDRGLIDEIRDGDEAPMDVNITGTIEFLSGHASDPNGGLPQPTEALTKTGLAASWTSSDSDPCRPYCIDIEVDYKPLCEDVYAELMRFPLFRYESIDGALKAATLTIPGKCNVLAPISIRYDQAA